MRLNSMKKRLQIHHRKTGKTRKSKETANKNRDSKNETTIAHPWPVPKAPLSSRSERTIEVGKVSPQRRLSFQSGGNGLRLFDVSWELHDFG